jgi:hypothetical protein
MLTTNPYLNGRYYVDAFGFKSVFVFVGKAELAKIPLFGFFETNVYFGWQKWSEKSP